MTTAAPSPAASRWWAGAAVLLLVVAIAVWSWIDGGVVFQLLRGDVSATDKVQYVRQQLAAAGPLAPLVYVLFVVVEVVVAPIPGLMLYAPGGAVFGGFWGGLLSLIGNVLGAGLACWLTRTLSRDRLDRLFESNRAVEIQEALQRRGAWLVFLLRLNPLTSCDLVSYAAGLTRMRISRVMLATAAGMAPLCFAQAWLAESVLEVMPGLLLPLVVCCVAYVLVAVLIVRRMLARTPSAEPALATAADETAAP